MSGTIIGRRTWTGKRDNEGHREFRVDHLIDAEKEDGPFVVMGTSGLPAAGDGWQFGNDNDPWAYCQADMDVKIHEEKQGEPNRKWIVSQMFTTKPQAPSKQRCQDTPVEDPIAEPAKINGSSVRYTEEKAFDRFGNFIRTSSFEQIRGPQAEFDGNRDQIVIEHNVGSFAAVAFALSLRDTVNTLPIWSIPRRCVKLSEVHWERRFYGKCSIYFNLRLTFDINYQTFDRDILDEGSKVLSGRWNRTTGEWELVNIATGIAPDPNNPQHFIVYHDRRGQTGRVILNGAGTPAGTFVSGATLFYVSVTNLNVGAALTDTTKWRAVVGAMAPEPQAWDFERAYVTGNVVSKTLSTGLNLLAFVALSGSTGVDPGDTGNGNWLLINQGSVVIADDSNSILPPCADRGNYLAAVTYNRGDYVRNPAVKVNAGNIHVENYNESNLVLLGIPTNFEVP